MKEILNAIKNQNLFSILHIECGDGELLATIKDEYPNIKIAGCDASKENIVTAKHRFAKKEWGEGWEKQMPSHDGKDYVNRTVERLLYRGPKLPNIDFQVGDPFSLPFHGASFDLVMTTGLLENVSPERVIRLLREVRRVNSRDGRVLFVEEHSKNPIKRIIARIGGKYVYDYNKLLSSIFFKNIRINNKIITATI